MALAGYKLRITGGLLAGEIVDVGLALESVTSDLAPATQYAYEITKYDANGLQTAWSSPAVLATTEAAPELMMILDEDGSALVDEDGAAVMEL